MPRFVTTTYPALMFHAGDKKFKFVGGKLDVTDEDAGLVREFADNRPAYKITEQNAQRENAEDKANKPDPFRWQADDETDASAEPTEDPNEVVAVGIIPPEAMQPAPDDDAQETDVVADDPGDAGDMSADPADETEDATESADANVHAEAELQPDAAPLDNDWDDMTNRKLDEELKERGLSTRGNHAEKVERLREDDRAL